MATVVALIILSIPWYVSFESFFFVCGNFLAEPFSYRIIMIRRVHLVTVTLVVLMIIVISHIRSLGRLFAPIAMVWQVLSFLRCNCRKPSRTCFCQIFCCARVCACACVRIYARRLSCMCMFQMSFPLVKSHFSICALSRILYRSTTYGLQTNASSHNSRYSYWRRCVFLLSVAVRRFRWFFEC